MGADVVGREGGGVEVVQFFDGDARPREIEQFAEGEAVSWLVDEQKSAHLSNGRFGQFW